MVYCGIFEMATGKPAVASTKSQVYIVYEMVKMEA